eukprot:7324153-Alexandrium_andersonii.AAC.1
MHGRSANRARALFMRKHGCSAIQAWAPCKRKRARSAIQAQALRVQLQRLPNPARALAVQARAPVSYTHLTLPTICSV